MKILVLTGSPHAGGTTDVLAGYFCDGARSAGHEIKVYSAGRMKVNQCRGCYSCSNGKCAVYRDDMDDFCDAMLTSDMIVFVTPLYFYHMSGAMKVVIDRFLSMNSRIKARRMKSMMFCAGWNTDPDCMDGVKRHYEILCRYMKWQDEGQLYAFGCTAPSDITGSVYAQSAFKMGASL